MVNQPIFGQVERIKLQARHERHYELCTRLCYLSDKQLKRCLSDASATLGWGKTQIISVGEHKVFVKRIPMTELEAENMFSSKNLFNIPCYYNYGVGSAGFGVFRELLTQIKITNSFLAGGPGSFPLLHHYRIVSATTYSTRLTGDARANYLNYWNKSKPIGRYIDARNKAPFDLVLCLEFIGQPIPQWIAANPDKLDGVFDQLLANIDSLQSQGLLHFDAHLQNMMTDGESLYLCDFGLALDKDFELGAKERQFFKQHRLYDYGQAISNIGDFVTIYYQRLNEVEKQAVQAKIGVAEEDRFLFNRGMLENASALALARLIDFDPEFLDLSKRYLPVIQLMQDFYQHLSNNKRKNTPFPALQLKSRLKKAGIAV